MPDWTVVYEQYARLLWQTTYRLLRDHDLAAECVQETFLSVIKRPANRQIVDLQKFIITVATRRALDHLRAKYQRQNHCRPLQDVDEVPSGSVSAEQMVLSDELASELRKALSEIPPQQAEIFCLRFFSDLTYRQIGDQLGLEESCVRVSVFRARQALQRRLAAFHPLLSSGDSK